MAHAPGISRLDLVLSTPGQRLPGRLSIPAQASGLVVFVHGSGSNRFSPRNQQVAEALQQGGLATLLFDVQATPAPSSALGHPPTWIELGQRVLAVLAGLQQGDQGRVADLPIGLFGASSGAAVALAAAAAAPSVVRAVVSRGGRPDLVPGCLGAVRAPTLLLVGSHDVDVLELNCWAAAQLRCRHDLRVVPDAGHLFAEPGALDCVARWSLAWFEEHLRS